MPKSTADLHGLLLVDKPAGWTSHDVVGKVRRLSGQRRIGHCGTLDPFATGLLVLCLGVATRLAEYISGHTKTYRGVVTLGSSTDTDDGEGDIIAEGAVPARGNVDLAAVAAQFVGSLRQRPPAFSAIHVDGKRAYQMARAGQAVDVPLRTVQVHSLQLDWINDRELSLEAVCGPGTYIRSLARDIGDVLGCGAHLSALRRLQSGAFSVSDAWPLDLLASVDHSSFADLLLPSDEGLTDSDAVLLAPDHAREFCSGLRIDVGEDVHQEFVRAFDSTGRFLGVGRIHEGHLKPAKVFPAGLTTARNGSSSAIPI